MPAEQARAHRSRLRLLESALAVMGEHGYEGTTFKRIAEHAGVSVGLACKYFPTKESIAFASYDRNARDLEAWASDMPSGTVGERFAATMHMKLSQMRANRRAFTAYVLRSLDPDARDGALGPAAEVIRSRFSGVFSVAVHGATNAPPPNDAARLARGLFGVHWLMLLLWATDRTPDQKLTEQAIRVAAHTLDAYQPMLLMAGRSGLGRKLDTLFKGMLRSSKGAEPRRIARFAMERIFRRRRVLPGVPLEPSEAAMALHLPRIESFVNAGEPIQLVLPAFPAKSPNPEKVLGTRPDTAEYLALQSLSQLLDEIAEAHPPGAELVVCSDGKVFADSVGVKDSDIDQYRRDLVEMIDEVGNGRIRFFGLEDALGPMKPSAARAQLMENYAQSVDEIRARAQRSPHYGALLDGIHRFLYEDELGCGTTLSKNQVKKQTRERAYEVVRRSDAWGRLVSAAFPNAVRLSIHPQPDVSEKIGIHLLPTDDEWLTPWHGVALLDGKRFRLIKRKAAEELGAIVVHEDGRPVYMELPS